MNLIADRYEPLGGMRQGGMSEAHECRDVRLRRKVILKRLQKTQDQRRLEDEQKALLRLRSNHVVQLLDIAKIEFNGEEITCLVLEHISGSNLSESMYTVGDEYLRVLWQIARGLKDIHKERIVHRDIKPDNIRVDDESVVKIIDFGLSREVGVDNRTQSAIGYFPYMAPELFKGNPITFTTATDVYAFAVVALAISEKGLPECCKKIGDKKLPPGLCATHLAGIDTSISTILDACLQDDPQDRPVIAAVLDAIERVLLKDTHRARIVIGGKTHELHKMKRVSSPQISLSGKVLAGVTIEYDGYHFIVQSIIGRVDANNSPLKVSDRMPRACVLAFHTKPGTNPLFATFDVSNPELLL